MTREINLRCPATLATASVRIVRSQTTGRYGVIEDVPAGYQSFPEAHWFDDDASAVAAATKTIARWIGRGFRAYRR